MKRKDVGRLLIVVGVVGFGTEAGLYGINCFDISYRSTMQAVIESTSAISFWYGVWLFFSK